MSETHGEESPLSENHESAYHSFPSDTFKKINLILIKGRDLDSILLSVCETLKAHRNYQDVKLAVLDDSLKITTLAETENKSLNLTGLFNRNTPSLCIKKTIALKKGMFFLHDSKICKNCFPERNCTGWASITTPLMFKQKIYGILFITIPKEIVAVKTEQIFLNEISESIGAGLHRIRQDEIYKTTTAALKKRKLELDYIYSLSMLTEQKDITLEEILQQAVNLIPSSMQYPMKTCAELFLADTDQRFKTKNFKETSLRLKSRIIVDNVQIGVLTICYSDSDDVKNELFFLREEELFVKSLSERIGKIIERKRGRKALEESERRFRDLTNNAVTGIAIFQDKNIVFQNPEYKKIFGSLSGSSSIFSDMIIHPDDREKIKEFHNKIIAENFIMEDIDFRICTGDPLSDRQNIKSVFCRAVATEFLSKKAVMLNVMDMTKPRELEHLLRIQDKMTSLGRVAAGIAHEIRNPLSGINIYLKSLEKKYQIQKNSDTEQKIISKIQTASNRIEAVIKRVMDFSKPGDLKILFLDINVPVQNALALASVTLRKSGTIIKKELDTNLPKCRADKNMIEQVLLNLLTNAAEAMKKNDPGTKLILVSTSCIENQEICIRVEDSGPGIPKFKRNKIFDPFYTTKNSSGIGLSICKRIINDHNGVLEARESSSLGGAEFFIQIPI